MSATLRKVKTGDPLDIPAATLRAFVDAARDYLHRRHGQGHHAQQAGQRNGIVLVKNAGGSKGGRGRQASPAGA